MSGTDLPAGALGDAIAPGAGMRENGDLFAIRGCAAAAAVPPVDAGGGKAGPSTGAGKPAWPAVVRIARRARVRARKNAQWLDPAAGPARCFIGKARGLFLRDCGMRFRKRPPGRRSPTQDPAKQPRKPRRWEPVATWPVYPRGPLALPSPGFPQDGLFRTCRGRPVRRRRSRKPGRAA